MSRITFGSFLCLCMLVMSAGAAVVEIPLPGLLGTYPVSETSQTRTVSFLLPAPPLSIQGAWFRIAGTTEVGTILCDGIVDAWPTFAWAYMYDGTPALVWGTDETLPWSAGPFAWTAAFRAFPPSGPTWSFLLDGAADISLSGGPAGFVDICTPTSPAPTITVTEAVLIVDGDFPIAVQTSTWGAIKALYR